MSSNESIPDDLRWASGVNKFRDGYMVQWRALTSNKKHTRTFKIEAEAQAFRDACAACIAEQQLSGGDSSFKLDNFPSFEQWEDAGRSNQWWGRVSGKLADELLRTDDLAKQETIRKNISAVAQAAKGAKPFIDTADLERRIEVMEEHSQAVRLKRKAKADAGSRGTMRHQWPDGSWHDEPPPKLHAWPDGSFRRERPGAN